MGDKNNISKILKWLKKENRPFTFKELLDRGLTRHYLKQLLEQGKIERLERGLYSVKQLDLSNLNIYQIATIMIGKPSSVCLLSALEYYNLTDQIPKKVWLMVPVTKRTKSKNIKLVRVRNPKWNIGIVKEGDFNITSVERTIIDSVLYKRLIGSDVAISSFKKAIKDNKTTLHRVVEVAKKLKVLNRIMPIIEVIL